ncbi:MAG: prephenate dehydrogenase, partial [Oligoflexia bacterium]|nr:prephenate dehydrogenase [Oligoflexia bacterium]
MKIAVIGTGHMGSWFVNELGSDHEVAVFDTDPAKTASLKQVRILEEITGLRDFAPSLLINAVSIRNTIPVYRNVAGIIPSDCVICDVASVKGELEDYYRTCGFEFVSLHPMFGPTFANINDLQEENVIIIKESSVKAVRFFRELFEKRQLNIFEFSFAEHDRMIAYSLTLPFASTLVFAACM